MRPMEPRESGYAVNPDDGVRLYYEVFGPLDADRSIVLLPTWHIVHSRVWKFQVPYFAQRGFRVVVYDPRGNGRSDRPGTAYSGEKMLGDALIVCETVGVEHATVVGLSQGVALAPMVASARPDLVDRLVLIGGGSGGFDCDLSRAQRSFDELPPDRNGWHKFNAYHWRDDYSDFVHWFMRMCISAPHSTKAIDDMVAWGHETNPETLMAGRDARGWRDPLELAPFISCPVLILHGSDDRVIPVECGFQLHQAFPNSRLVIVEQGSHVTTARDPVHANELIHDFLGRELPRKSTWPRPITRPRRALFVSSPIGLGHAQRDLAIAEELRALRPDLEIDWLAQPPVTDFLEERGERIHPLSEWLAGESEHIESWATDDHRLNVFMSIRDMDEILLTNFFVFLDAVRQTQYDVWICDEAWDVDRYLFENPELKTAPYVWLTDVVGYLPGDVNSATEWERFVAADYNAELINQMDRFPTLRDRSLYIGDPEDLPPEPLGPGLPTIPEWAERTHDFSGYVRYFDPDALPDQAELRRRFGLPEDGRIAVASCGGTSVGNAVLRRMIESWSTVQRACPGLRLVVVGGPRVDLTELPDAPGIDYRGYVPDLYKLFAAADVALVQGGLSTTMELVALQKPFLSFPLREHYEQQHHVSWRLKRYGVPEWTRIQFPDATPDLIAQRVARLLDNPPRYQQVEGSGARRIAELIAPLIGRPGTARVDTNEVISRKGLAR